MFPNLRHATLHHRKRQQELENKIEKPLFKLVLKRGFDALLNSPREYVKEIQIFIQVRPQIC